MLIFSELIRIVFMFFVKHFPVKKTWFYCGSLCNFLRRHSVMSSEGDTERDNMPILNHVEKRPIEIDGDPKHVKKIVLDPVEVARRKRRKYAILLSYSGKGYLGMQRNPGLKTIEDDLLNAMLQAGLVTEADCTLPQMCQFQRAARTDKGVSAARQIVSIKLQNESSIKDLINSHLPEQIRVMHVKRATRSFDSKLWCDSRTYSYTSPTFAFAPLEAVTNEDYRITDCILDEIKNIMSTFKGTHNFHNFTAGKKPDDQSAKRYIMDISYFPPFEKVGLEWITIKIKGQSFMIHQIRKMVGMCMAICRGLATRSTLEMALNESDRLDIPIAPGLGLVLEEPHYETYNKRFGSDGLHEALDWSDVSAEVESFRESHINRVIYETEVAEKCMMKWLQTLPLHTFSVRDEAEGGSSSEGKLSEADLL